MGHLLEFVEKSLDWIAMGINGKNFRSPAPRVLLSLKYPRGQESHAIALEQPPIDGKPENLDHEVQQRMYLRACWGFVMTHG